MNAPAAQTRPGAVDPFACGLPRPVVLRLLAGAHTAADRKLYYRTDWWRATKAKALEHYGRACALCDSPVALQVHHRKSGYRALFREDPAKHLTVLCRNCHRRFHHR